MTQPNVEPDQVQDRERHGQPDETIGDIRKRARRDADDVLRTYWPGMRIPVDPVALARRAGTSVFTAQLGDDDYGMIIGSGTSADIYVDRDQPYNRFRFTTAHELGHYIDHSTRGDNLASSEGYIDRRSEDGRGTAPEIYANEFAASVLMPEQKLREAVGAGMNLFQLASMFEVSTSAMSWRLHHLGLALQQG